MSGEDEVVHYNKTPVSPESFMKLRSMDLEAGVLGRFFGGTKTSPFNVAGFSVLALILLGVGITIFSSSQSTELWKLITPIITLSLGYLFGKGGSK